MKLYEISEIRNVGIIGHGSSGKTSLTSALLFSSGTVNRLGRVDQGNTVTDFDEEEIARKVSISSALCYLEWKKIKLNIIDTPGYGAFIADAKAALRVLDGALVVVDGVAGVEVQTEEAWGYAEEVEPLMEKFYASGTLSQEDLAAGLARGVRQKKIFPVLCVSALANIGAHPLLDACVAYLPHPGERGPFRGENPKDHAPAER